MSVIIKLALAFFFLSKLNIMINLLDNTYSTILKVTDYSTLESQTFESMKFMPYFTIMGLAGNQLKYDPEEHGRYFTMYFSTSSTDNTANPPEYTDDMVPARPCTINDFKGSEDVFQIHQNK